jgi:ferric-dicitrate binding protein FerR (iron transport regulator)
MKIEALGTIFNVSNYSENNYTSTTLIDGSIKVSNPQGENETIKPGYQVKFFHNQNRLIINNVKKEKNVSINFIQKDNETNLLTTNNKETLKALTTI